jgi:hypothetical protein
MKFVIANNLMNILDSLTTIYLFQNPDNIKFELNMLIKNFFMKFGYPIFIFKIIIILIISLWYYKKYKINYPTYYAFGMNVCLFYFVFLILMNFLSIISEWGMI